MFLKLLPVGLPRPPLFDQEFGLPFERPRPMKLYKILLIVVFQSSMALCQGVTCDLHAYKPLDGLKAEVVAGELQVTWQGEREQQLRAVFAVKDRQPLVRGARHSQRYGRLEGAGAQSLA